ncbi:MAG: hypothetical protein PHE73_07865 [Sulfurovaceae bacterium]|nr:hypothetical protein [Sulfurovaceae bacterium]
MSKIQIKHLGAIGIVSGVLLLSGCSNTGSFLGGAVVGAALMNVYDHPRYHDRPYYYYNNQYYYGGEYRNGYYYHNGHRLHGGHYYYH